MCNLFWNDLNCLLAQTEYLSIIKNSLGQDDGINARDSTAWKA